MRWNHACIGAGRVICAIRGPWRCIGNFTYRILSDVMPLSDACNGCVAPASGFCHLPFNMAIPICRLGCMITARLLPCEAEDEGCRSDTDRDATLSRLRSRPRHAESPLGPPGGGGAVRQRTGCPGLRYTATRVPPDHHQGEN